MKGLKNDSASTLRSIFNQFASQTGLDDKMKYSSIPEIWKDIVGDKIASHTKVVNADYGKLVISTESSTWRAEIILRKKSIIEKINNTLGKELITDLVIK